MTALATGPSSMPSLDSRFRGNDIALRLFSVMPALRLRSGQAPAGIQDLLLLRVNANEIRSRVPFRWLLSQDTSSCRYQAGYSRGSFCLGYTTGWGFPSGSLAGCLLGWLSKTLSGTRPCARPMSPTSELGLSNLSVPKAWYRRS